MKLIQETVQLTEQELPTTVEEFVAALNQQLKGKKLAAFGKDDQGHWGAAAEPKTFTVAAVTSPYYDEDQDKAPTRSTKGVFVSLDIHLTGYKASANGLIYTSKKFYEELTRALVEVPAGAMIASIGYSEQGMQGSNYVNFDAKVKFPRK